MTSARRPTATLRRALMLAIVLLALPVASAAASSQQTSIIEDDAHLELDPGGTLARLRLLGAQVVRISVHWDMIAPAPTARRAPAGFNASDPAAYPVARWKLW